MSGIEVPPPCLGSLSETFWNLKYLDWLIMPFPALPKVFFQSLFQEMWGQYLGAHTNSKVQEYVWLRHQ